MFYVCRFHWDSSHTGLLPYDSSHGTPPNRDPSRPGLLPNWTPPRELLPKRVSSRNRIAPETGFLPKRDSSRNGITPETGFLPKRDYSRNGIPPETGFLQKRDSSRNRIPPETGFIPKQDSSRDGIPPEKWIFLQFREESRLRRIPVLGREFS